MELLLIRHGRTQGNLERRYVGRTDEPLLSEETRRLSRLTCRSFEPEAVYVSPMLRCRQTAELLFPGKEPFLCDGLRETNFGEFEYRNYEELKDNAAYQAWIDSGGTIAFPGGEAGEDFRERCCSAFEALLADARARKLERAAVIAHGGTIMAIMERFARPKRGFYDWQLKNGESLCVIVQRDAAGDWLELYTPDSAEP